MPTTSFLLKNKLPKHDHYFLQRSKRKEGDHPRPIDELTATWYVIIMTCERERERERERGQGDCLVRLVHYIEGVGIIILLGANSIANPPLI